jgi:hypothetical protein
MQFMLALIAEERSWEDVTPEEVKKNLADMGQFNAELTKAGAFVTGAGLQERATSSPASGSSTSRTSTRRSPGRRKSRSPAITSKSARW